MIPENTLSIPSPLDHAYADGIREAVNLLNEALERAHRAELVLQVQVMPGLPGTRDGKAPIIAVHVFREL
jgi:hypothetical protein